MQSQWMLSNKNFVKDGNAIGSQRLINSSKQANKKQGEECGGGLWNFIFERFPASGKMRGSQSVRPI
jgi:hypothetical protein